MAFTLGQLPQNEIFPNLDEIASLLPTKTNLLRSNGPPGTELSSSYVLGHQSLEINYSVILGNGIKI